jgi:hypothetical protein
MDTWRRTPIESMPIGVSDTRSGEILGSRCISRSVAASWNFGALHRAAFDSGFQTATVDVSTRQTTLLVRGVNVTDIIPLECAGKEWHNFHVGVLLA